MQVGPYLPSHVICGILLFLNHAAANNPNISDFESILTKISDSKEPRRLLNDLNVSHRSDANDSESDEYYSDLDTSDGEVKVEVSFLLKCFYRSC